MSSCLYLFQEVNKADITNFRTFFFKVSRKSISQHRGLNPSLLGDRSLCLPLCHGDLLITVLKKYFSDQKFEPNFVISEKNDENELRVVHFAKKFQKKNLKNFF